jgi:hypothetical protein
MGHQHKTTLELATGWKIAQLSATTDFEADEYS